ncbi:MAG: histidine kinase dimerization/phospho-acceptor domain-containing protein [Pseudomonadota bacterium]
MDTRFKQEITRLFYKQVPFVSISLFFVLAAAYYFLKKTVPDVILISWVAVNLTLSITLLLIYFAYQRRADERNASFWFNIYVALLLLQDVSLGMLGPMSALTGDDLSKFFILFLLAGMAAGTIATRGIRFETYILSASALLLPVGLTHAVMDHELSGAILILTTVFYIFMLFVGKNYSDTISSNIHLWLNLEQEIETRKLTEVELTRAKQVAEIANQTKNQFLANVSHELRTPLNGIIGFSSALSKCKLDNSAASFVDHIGRCSKSLLSMVNDVLDISTIEAGKLELREHPFNLSNEIDEVVALAQRLSEDKGLTFECHMAANLPQNLIGDAQRIKQILNNLIHNSIKYTE